MYGDHQRKRVALGLFLKHKRSKVSHKDFQLSNKKRRRVKGLRREELAELCGISSTWVCWIEQGRAQSLSSLTLDSICDVL